ncbi:MAG: glycosyltransferase family 2 protein [candidate division WOR-3 bacterium]
MNDKVSVVIINYNGDKFVEKLIVSLNQQTYPYSEVVLVDNNSSDKSYLYLLKNLKNVTLFRLSENKGFSFAVNLGVKQSKFENIILLNNDVYLEKNFIKNCIENITQNKDYHFFSPLVLDYNGEFIDSAGDDVGKFIRPYKKLHGKKLYEIQMIKGDVKGFSMSICYFLKDCFVRAGMLDERFFMYFEDVDFSLRLKKCGFKILFTPDTVGYHFISGTTKLENRMSEYSSKKVFWEGRNRVFIYFKNYKILSLKNWVSFILGTLISILFHIIKTKKFSFYMKGLFCGFLNLKGIRKNG